MEVIDVLNVRNLADSKTGCFKSANTKLQAIIGHNNVGLRANVTDHLSKPIDPRWNFSLEFSASGKDNN
jgi:phosphotransferase system IIB component